MQSSQPLVPFIPGLHLSMNNSEIVVLLGAAACGSMVGSVVNILPFFFQ
jgi:hypothetical protein